MLMLIDMGLMLSYIWEDFVVVIGQQFNVEIDMQGNYFVDCKYRDVVGMVDFGFNSGVMVINVWYKDFIYQFYLGRCMFGVQLVDYGSMYYVLGDMFIRGVYCEFCLFFIVSKIFIELIYVYIVVFDQ